MTFPAVLVAAALLLAGAPAPAATQASPAPSAPIRVDHADIAPVLDGAPDPQSSGYVDIWFRNLSDSPATLVEFAMEGTDNYPKLTITDRGSFKKGAVIQHHFIMLLRDRNLHVVVIHAEFADGTTWDDTGSD